MTKIDEFIINLANYKTPNDCSLNIYAGNSKEAEIKRTFLRYYLNEMKKLNPKRIFIGEAPGRNGCFITGVPFTDESSMVTKTFFAGVKYLLPNNTPQKERTASIVWDKLSTIPINEYPLMWNIYPFHPSDVDSSYLSAKDRKNRKPNKEECIRGIEILEKLIYCFDSITEYYAIGRVPERYLKKKYINITYIRHPSWRGVSIFRNQFDAIFSCKKLPA